MSRATTRLEPTDLANVVEFLPVSLRTAMMEAETFVCVAGGAIRDLVCGDSEPKDIDVFGDSAGLLRDMAGLVAACMGGELETRPNTVLVKVPDAAPVQFVTGWVGKDGADVIDQFDFGCCCAAVYYDSVRCRFESVCGPSFYSDCELRLLTFLAPEREEMPSASLLRTIRLVERGWRIAPESLAGVVARFVTAAAGQDRSAESKLAADYAKRLCRADDARYEVEKPGAVCG